METETSGEIENHLSSHLDTTDLYSLDNETNLDPSAYTLRWSKPKNLPFCSPERTCLHSRVEIAVLPFLKVKRGQLEPAAL